MAELTQYGFKIGAMEVMRAIEDDEGYAGIVVKTPTKQLNIFATPEGNSLRVYCDGRELS